jgi:hypothetical protein
MAVKIKETVIFNKSNNELFFGYLQTLGKNIKSKQAHYHIGSLSEELYAFTHDHQRVADLLKELGRNFDIVENDLYIVELPADAGWSGKKGYIVYLDDTTHKIVLGNNEAAATTVATFLGWLHKDKANDDTVAVVKLAHPYIDVVVVDGSTALAPGTKIRPENNAAATIPYADTRHTRWTVDSTNYVGVVLADYGNVSVLIDSAGPTFDNSNRLVLADIHTKILEP